VKVVVNKCYGGFSLSYDGVVEYAKRSGFPLFAYVSARTADGGFDLDLSRFSGKMRMGHARN
jgi:hypothetical protein